MAEVTADKTHEPTPHRRQQARAEGRAARSQDLTAAVLLLAGLGALGILGRSIAAALFNICRRQLSGHAWLQTDVDSITGQFHGLLADLAQVVLPVFGVMLVAVTGVQLMQTGLLFLPDRLAPDITRIDPLAGLGRLFTVTAVVRLGFALLKLAVVGGVAYACIAGQSDMILSLAGLEPSQFAAWMADALFGAGLKIGLALLMLGLCDYGYQWWRHERELRMTTDQLREELRQLQGDPQLVSRRLQAQRGLSLNRFGPTVPRTDRGTDDKGTAAAQFNVRSASETPVVQASASAAAP